MSAAEREVQVCHLNKAIRMPYRERVLMIVRRISNPIVLPQLEHLIIRDL